MKTNGQSYGLTPLHPFVGHSGRTYSQFTGSLCSPLAALGVVHFEALHFDPGRYTLTDR